MNTCPTCPNDLVCHDLGECKQPHAPDYGEPWQVHYPANPEEWICTRDGLHADVVCDPPKDADKSFELWPERRARIITCVNACAGLSDPAAHMAAMKEAFNELQNIANANPSTWGEMADQFLPWAQNRARHALTKLQPYLK